jgi:phosphatidylcholine synthase
MRGKIGRVRLAWAAHLFTATGAVLGLFALLAVIEGDAKRCLFWLGAALIVDGVDGALARWVGVREAIPEIDGAILDLVIDYLTYVVVPALFLRQFGLLPDGVETPLAAYVLATSLYCFANTGMKSADNDFVGFPAIWNTVALYLWILGLHPALNAVIVLMLGALTFTSMKFPHPLRVRALMPLTLAAVTLWGATCLWLIVAHPVRPPVALTLWLAATGYGVALCLWRTLRGSHPGGSGPPQNEIPTLSSTRT